MMDSFFIQSPYAIEVPDIAAVFGKLLQAGLGDTREKWNRVSPALGPQAGVDAPEQLHGIPSPAPPHVVRQGFQKNQILGNVRLHLVGFEASHKLDSIPLWFWMMPHAVGWIGDESERVQDISSS
jgi:hypothetical protein